MRARGPRAARGRPRQGWAMAGRAGPRGREREEAAQLSLSGLNIFKKEFEFKLVWNLKCFRHKHAQQIALEP